MIRHSVFDEQVEVTGQYSSNVVIETRPRRKDKELKQEILELLSNHANGFSMQWISQRLRIRAHTTFRCVKSLLNQKRIQRVRRRGQTPIYRLLDRRVDFPKGECHSSLSKINTT